MPSVESSAKAIEMRQQLTTMGDKAKFHIRKWISNRREVSEDIPEEDRASEINLEMNELPSTKTLGMTWAATDDQFSFQYSPPDEEFVYTKRNVLRCTATVFDPLGFLAPFILLEKLLMQQAWVKGLSWDDALLEELRLAWKQWFGELVKLASIKIPRCLRESSTVKHIEIHTFSDASEKAYSANVYARHEYEDGGVSVRLVATNTRLAPLKTITIPRLELMGAVIGLRLSKQVCKALEIPLQDVTFWMDSMTVRFWIRGQSRRYKTFVAHRVGEIHEDSNPVQWRYVPTLLNPADHGTRGLTASELKDNELWWNGPDFLREPREKWPEEKCVKKNAEILQEIELERKEDMVCLNTSQQNEREDEWRLKPSRFSKWYCLPRTKKLEFGLSLVRVKASVNRFITNCRKFRMERLAGELTAVELKTVEEEIIRDAQTEAYGEEITALKGGQPLPKRSSIF